MILCLCSYSAVMFTQLIRFWTVHWTIYSILRAFKLLLMAKILSNIIVLNYGMTFSQLVSYRWMMTTKKTLIFICQKSTAITTSKKCWKTFSIQILSDNNKLFYYHIFCTGKIRGSKILSCFCFSRLDTFWFLLQSCIKLPATPC